MRSPTNRELSVKNEKYFSCPFAFSLKGVIGVADLLHTRYWAILKDAEKANRVSVDIYP